MSKFKAGDLVWCVNDGQLLEVADLKEKEGCVPVIDKVNLEIWYIDKDLLEHATPLNLDSERLEWLFENSMSELNRRIIFGAGVSLDNFRERIDALMIR